MQQLLIHNTEKNKQKTQPFIYFYLLQLNLKQSLLELLGRWYLKPVYNIYLIEGWQIHSSEYVCATNCTVRKLWFVEKCTKRKTWKF